MTYRRIFIFFILINTISNTAIAEVTMFRINNGETLWGELNQAGMSNYVECVIGAYNINPNKISAGFEFSIPKQCIENKKINNVQRTLKPPLVPKRDVFQNNVQKNTNEEYKIKPEQQKLNSVNLIILKGSYLKERLEPFLLKRGIRLDWDLQCDIQSNVEFVYDGAVEEILKKISDDLEESKWNLSIEYSKFNAVRVYSNDNELKC